MTFYGAGLRIIEAVSLKVAGIASQRMLIRVGEGKGRTDRHLMLSQRLLSALRAYCRAVRPEGEYLFPSWRAHSRSVFTVRATSLSASSSARRTDFSTPRPTCARVLGARPCPRAAARVLPSAAQSP